jgi:hypothetical protein
MNQNGKQPLAELEKILKKNRAVLLNAADTIREQDVSNYPIFVAAQQEVEIGIPLLTVGQLPNNWLINASTLEEFHSKRLIDEEKINDFRNLYKSRSSEICIFAFLTEGVAKFVFIPA